MSLLDVSPSQEKNNLREYVRVEYVKKCNKMFVLNCSKFEQLVLKKCTDEVLSNLVIWMVLVL